MGTLYRITIDEKTTYKLGDPWPTGPGPDGTPLSDKYGIGAMFHSPEQAGDEDEEILPAYFELWAQPKGIPHPAEDFPTFRLRLWLDAPMKWTEEVWMWADMEAAIALRMGFDPDERQEEQQPPNGSQKPALAPPPG